MFRHPKYYKELRRRNNETQQKPQRILDKPGRLVSNSDQAISGAEATAEVERSPGPGLKQQAIEETVPHNDIEEASSFKLQASSKPEPSSGSQASSDKRQAPGSKLQASSHKLQAPRS